MLKGVRNPSLSECIHFSVLGVQNEVPLSEIVLHAKTFYFEP